MARSSLLIQPSLPSFDGLDLHGEKLTRGDHPLQLPLLLLEEVGDLELPAFRGQFDQDAVQSTIVERQRPHLVGALIYVISPTKVAFFFSFKPVLNSLSCNWVIDI